MAPETPVFGGQRGFDQGLGNFGIRDAGARKGVSSGRTMRSGRPLRSRNSTSETWPVNKPAGR